jgi:hypothetical protein
LAFGKALVLRAAEHGGKFGAGDVENSSTLIGNPGGMRKELAEMARQDGDDLTYRSLDGDDICGDERRSHWRMQERKTEET